MHVDATKFTPKGVLFYGKSCILERRFKSLKINQRIDLAMLFSIQIECMRFLQMRMSYGIGALRAAARERFLDMTEETTRGAILAFRRDPTPLETLAAMRARFDRGGYVLLRILGVTHAGVEDHLTISAPHGRLSAMRARCDGGEYGLYVAIGTRHDGRIDRVTVFGEARSRLAANQ